MRSRAEDSWIDGRRTVAWHWLALGVVVAAAWMIGWASTSRPGAAAALAVAIPAGIAGASARGWFATGEELPTRGRGGWLLLGAGAVILSVGAPSAAGPGLVAGDLGTALGACLGAIGLLWLIGGRVRDRWIDAVVEALLVAAPISYLAVAFLVDRRADAVTLPEAVAVVVAVALDVVLVVCALHLRAAQPSRSPAADLLVVGSTALLLVHGARAWTSLTEDSNLDLSSAGMVVAAMAAGMWAVATLCPEARLEPDRIETLPTPLTRVRLAIIVLCVAVGPMTLAVRVTTERTDGIGGLAAGAVVVAGVAVAYLVRLVEQRARVEYLALHDDLCQLPNRVLLDDRISTALGQASRNGSSVALLFLDLDRFKTINDSLGHAAGNELLRAVGERLSGSVRASDTVARLGGDEFAVLLPEVRSASTPATVAEKIIGSFAEPFEILGRHLFVSPSIGISLHPQDATDATELLRNADSAMYRSKANGRNTFEVYTPELNDTAHRRLTMETFLHRAVERDELVLHYQPKVELRSGRIVGMEALLRWQHPELGLLFPGDFIPLAEETGLIVPVGEWALEQACAQTKQWNDAGHDTVTVAVNLSARQFQQLQVGDMVARVLRSTGLDARALELELTESLALQDPDGIVATLEELKDIGVQCSIDDFGTGYSGLQYLSRFPIDKLKIDKFFVNEISNPADEGRIVAAVIALAHGLRLDVVAEGVETEEQLAFLHRSGCDEMQGFLFSRPVPPDEFEKMLVSPPAFARGPSGDPRPAEPRLRLVGGAQPPLR